MRHEAPSINQSIKTHYLLIKTSESLFILSVAYLLQNAVSYDGEILQADTYRPCANHLLGFISVRVSLGVYR